MLLAQNLLDDFNRHIRILDFTAALPLNYNKKLHTIQTKTGLQLKFQRLRITLAIVSTFWIFTQICLTWKEASIFVKFHSILVISTKALLCYTQYSLFRNTNQFVAFINAMLEFEKHRNGTAKTKCDINLNFLLTQILLYNIQQRNGSHQRHHLWKQFHGH